MEHFLLQIRKALKEDLYFPILFAVLAIPDLCGAVDSQNGEASKEKYVTWFDKYIAPKYNGFLSGEDCYYFRCSLLHQGSSQHRNSSYERVLFVEPSATHAVFHNNILGDALNIDVGLFCEDMIQGVEKWLRENEENELHKQNYSKFMRRYPDGLSPYIVGVPVIS
jgi:hypothetical protein